MALSTQDPILAKRRFFHAVALDAAVQAIAVAFFSWINQQGGKPDLQVKEFDNLTNTDTVIADAACKVYAIVLKKGTTTAAFFKGTDHASTGATDGTQQISLRQNSVKVDILVFPKGLPMAAGLTLRSNTTGTGNTTSAAGDGASGVVLLGAA
jgi:hypothetical protein